MTLVEGLRALRGKVEQGWTQGKYARDAAGKATLPRAPDACSWCLLGACQAQPDLFLHQKLEVALREETGDLGVALWNDAPARTKDEVLALVDRAIAKAA